MLQNTFKKSFPDFFSLEICLISYFPWFFSHLTYIYVLLAFFQGFFLPDICFISVFFCQQTFEIMPQKKAVLRPRQTGWHSTNAGDGFSNQVMVLVRSVIKQAVCCQRQQEIDQAWGGQALLFAFGFQTTQGANSAMKLYKERTQIVLIKGAVSATDSLVF